MAIPGHLVFIFIIRRLATSPIQLTFLFIVLYLTAALIQVSQSSRREGMIDALFPSQVAILLFVAQWLVSFVWRHGRDPDNVSIPYLTAIGDLLGTALLTCVFLLQP